jgi:predicted permease
MFSQRDEWVTAFRGFRHHRGFAFTVVTILAAGITASTTIYAIVYSVLLRPLEYAHPERLVCIWEEYPKMSWGHHVAASFPTFHEFKRYSHSFDAMELAETEHMLVSRSGENEFVWGTRLSAGFLDLLGVKPYLGRNFLPEEDRPDGMKTAILGYAYWKKRFAGDTNLLGKTILINNSAHVLVGILPRDFQQPAGSEPRVLLPIRRNATDTKGRGWRGFLSLGRLKPGISAISAQQELNTIAKRLAELYPENNTGLETSVVPLYEQTVDDAKSTVWLLFAAANFILLIACANAANLFLVQSVAREKDMAVRAALGATRWQIARGLLIESVALSLLAAAIGIGMASVCIKVARTIDIGLGARFEAASLNFSVLGFAISAAFASGIAFGLVPAGRMSLVNPALSLNESSRTASAGKNRGRFLRGLIVFEISLSLILLIGAGLMFKSLERVLSQKPGFDPEGMLVANVDLPEARIPESQRRLLLYSDLLARIRRLPGVESASLTSNLPLSGADIGGDIMIEDDVKPWTNEQPLPAHLIIESDYFRTLKIPLLKGRIFDSSDSLDARKVSIVSEETAKQLWPGKDVLGKRFTSSLEKDGSTVWFTVIGIVGDVRYRSMETRPKLAIYFPLTQTTNENSSMQLVLRTVRDPLALRAAVQREMHATSKEIPEPEIVSMDQIIAKSVGKRRLQMELLWIFTAIALILAMVGTYAIVTYILNQRAREFEIRLVLGATRNQILGLALRQGLKLVGCGLAAGLAISLLLTRFLQSFLFEIAALDPVPFTAGILLLGVVGLLACYIPARRIANAKATLLFLS